MKLISHGTWPEPGPSKRPRPAIIRWIRARSGLERALFLKGLFALVTAAIAIYAVHLMAHTMWTLEHSINP